MGITVAVTGPTGEIGLPAVAALERRRVVDRIIGMARRPFDPAAHGWTKTEYRQGDVLDRTAVEALVEDADVVLHLAYLILGSRTESRRVNIEGSRNVFEATATAARPTRLVYLSSVAAYGFHDDNPTPLTEDVPVRGSHRLYYSQQKAECELLLAETTTGSGLDVFVLRPCVVAGQGATALADDMPWTRVAGRLPAAVRRAAGAVPGLRPVLPDPGTPLQLVHHDDVATAVAAAVIGRGAPGAYNIAGDGTVSLSQVAHAIDAHALRVPLVAATGFSAVLARLPRVPPTIEWVHVARSSVVMDTAKAKRELGWQPAYTSQQTLESMARELRARRAPRRGRA